jgi:DNA adenine methylase
MITTASKRTSQPLKWHGGKHYLASRIISMFPPHIHYVEPYFGGGAVFLAKPVCFIVDHSEVINDLNGELTNFWSVLRDSDSFEVFKRIVEATPMSKPVWDAACRSRDGSAVQRAANFFVRYRQSRQGLGRDFATMSRSRTRRGMNEQVSSWLAAIEGLYDAHLRLQRVVIFNESAVDVIRREDSCDSFFYCDPPYVHATREVANAYTCEMNDSAHVELLETLGRITGKFILSGYRCDIYDAAAKQYGWKRIDIEIDNKSSGSKVKPIKTECLWLNYDCEETSGNSTKVEAASRRRASGS